MKTHILRTVVPLLPIVAILVAACSGDDASSEPTRKIPASVPRNATISVAGAENLDEMLLRIGDQSPGFGGIYWDSTGLRIVHTRTAALAEAVAAIRNVMGPDVPALHAPHISLRPARFTFRELTDYRSSIEEETDHTGFITSDVDEVNNQVKFEVENTTVKQRILRAAAALKVPIEAVTVDVIARPKPASDLTSRGPTLAGGPIIGFPFGLPGCTLGFPVSFWDGQQALITAGHCAQPTGSVNTAYTVSQPYSAINEGTEYLDPPYTALTGCYPGDVCRYSETTIFHWVNNPAYGAQSFGLGLIATPAWDNYGWGNSGPITYTDYSTIIGEAPDSWLMPASPGGPLMGQPMSKVGVTTGFTSGEITQSCFTYYGTSGQSKDNLCQFSTDTYAAPGDSGSPFFIRDLWPRIYIAGVLHSVSDPVQRSYFSSITGIQRDYGPLQTYPAKPHP